VAATLPPGRTSQTSSRAPVGHAQLDVRWDRVCVFFALLVVLAIVMSHTAVRAIRDDPQTPAATQPRSQTRHNTHVRHPRREWYAMRRLCATRPVPHHEPWH
jgi:hypothetical protein